MDLEYFRAKRLYIKTAMEQKHSEWLHHAEKGNDEIADVIQVTISKLAKQHEECMADIARVKKQLIEEHTA